MSVDVVVERYIALRDRKAAMKKEFDAAVRDIDDAMDKIENFLLKRLNDQGVNSMSTSAGTCYVTTKTNVSIADWDSYRRFLEDQEDPFLFLDRKANKAAIEAFKEEHQDLPPGVNWTEMRAVNVRR